jgi:hypothetical protein
VVVVLVVHGQQVDCRMVEFPRAAAADPGEQFQRQVPVALFALLSVAPCVGDDPIEVPNVGPIFLRGHRRILSLLPEWWKLPRAVTDALAGVDRRADGWGSGGMQSAAVRWPATGWPDANAGAGPGIARAGVKGLLRRPQR